MHLLCQGLIAAAAVVAVGPAGLEAVNQNPHRYTIIVTVMYGCMIS